MDKELKRADSIDLLRGFIMMTMALDHASAMIAHTHFTEIWGVPFSAYPSLGWWLTRFVSHLCAPGFFFLMGMSIFLFAEKRLRLNWEAKQIQNYFLKRGGIILLIMFFVEMPAWGFSMLTRAESAGGGGMNMPGLLPDGAFPIPTTVLYGLGACMMIGGFLWRLKSWQLLSITLASFGLSWWYISHSIPNEMFNPLEHFVLVPGMSPFALVIYPIIPWLGVMTFGLFWAQLLRQMPDKIYNLSLLTGLVFIGICVGLRFLEWGNFSIADNDDWISFFTLVKYPPSVAFALMTCGINLVLFFLFSSLSTLIPKLLHPVKIFGQTAMFFYLAHLYLYALMSVAFPTGTSIGIMYLMWLIGLVLLYFICQRFLVFKQQKPHDSLWRMI